MAHVPSPDAERVFPGITHFAVGALCFSVAFLAYYRMLTIYWGPRAIGPERRDGTCVTL